MWWSSSPCTAPGGQVISELDEDAGEHMHLIAFRDLTGYQHIMPQQGESTSWWGILNLRAHGT